MKKIFTTILCLSILSSTPLTLADSAEEIPYECKKYLTPSTDPPSILINEVSFKDSPDWIEFYVEDDKNNGLGISLKDFAVKDDGIIKRLPALEVKTGDFFTITFGNSGSDSGTELFSEKAGLTGTTEQITIESDYAEILDAVCWTSSSPTKGEKEDFQELYESDQWASSKISTCISSKEIKNNESIGRIDFEDSNSNSDWQIFETTTKGEDNSPPEIPEDPVNPEVPDDPENPETPKEPETSTETFYPQVIINEVMPNPEGTDSGNEWIELKNPNNEEVDLAGWTLDDEEEGSKPYIIEVGSKIPANSYLAIFSNESKINLNNDYDKIRIFDPAGTLKDEVFYEDAKSGQSFSRKEEITWYWSTTPTPNNTNIEILTPKTETSQESEDKEEEKIYQDGDTSDEIEITELLPNPEGQDSGNEWIEIHNNSDEDLNLGNWTIDDQEAGSKPFTISDATVIKKGEFLAFSSKETKINLGNKTDEIRLFAPSGEIMDSIDYENAPSGMSYSKIQLTENGRLVANLIPSPISKNKWQWTKQITKGTENPKHEILIGEVTKEVTPNSNEFEIRHGDKNIAIHFQDASLDKKIGSLLIKEGSIIEIEGTKIGENKYDLQSYTLKSFQTSKEPSSSTFPIAKIFALLALITAIALSGFHLYKNFHKSIMR
jgi:hypothetical protein